MQREELNYDESQMVVVGKFKGTYGLKGWLKLESYLEKKHWKNIRRIFLKRKSGEFVPFEVESTKAHGKDLIVKLSNVSSIEEASKMASAKVFLPKQELPKKKRGEYYYFELEGMEVYAEDGTKLGKVTSICDSYPYAFLVLDNEKLYVPFVKEIVLKVEKDRIVVSNLLKDLL